MKMKSIVSFIIILNCIQNALSICDTSNNTIYCNGFKSFKEITFNNKLENIKIVTLIPDIKIILNDDLNLENVQLVENFVFKLENLLGIELVEDPFGSQILRTGDLYLSNSNFSFFEDNELIYQEKCSSILNIFV